MPTNIRRTKSFSLDLRHIDEEMPILPSDVCVGHSFLVQLTLKKVDTKENTCDRYLEGCIDAAA